MRSPLVARCMKLTSEQVGTLSALLREGGKLHANSGVGALVQWRTEVAVYLRGAVPSEHYVWNVLPDVDQYELPYATARDRAFAENWAPLLGALRPGPSPRTSRSNGRC